MDIKARIVDDLFILHNQNYNYWLGTCPIDNISIKFEIHSK